MNPDKLKSLDRLIRELNSSVKALRALELQSHFNSLQVDEDHEFRPDFWESLDIKNPVLGFRSWNIRNGELRPLNDNGDSWIPGLNKAVCWSGCNTCPSPRTFKNLGCHCGFNAWFSTDHLRLGGGEIFGAIAGAGKTEIHSEGFRSEEAQIIGLAYSFHIPHSLPTNEITRFLNKRSVKQQKKKAERLAERYGVPVFDSLKDLEEFAKNYATPVDRI